MSVALFFAVMLVAAFAWLAVSCIREQQEWIAEQEHHEQRDHAEIRKWAKRAHAAEEELEKLRAMVIAQSLSEGQSR